MHAFFFSENSEAGLSTGVMGWFPSTLDSSHEFITWVASECPSNGESQQQLLKNLDVEF